MTNLMRIFFENPGTVFRTWYKSFYPTLAPSTNIIPPTPTGNTYYFAPRYFAPRYFSKGYFGAF